MKNKNLKVHRFHTVYNREIADNDYAELIKAGTALNPDQHEACLMLCEYRNEMINEPHALFNTGCVFHDEYRSFIENNDLLWMLYKVNMPGFDLRGYADDLLTDKDFGDSEVYVRENGETVTRGDAVLYAQKCLGEVIKAIKSYLYSVDKEHGTDYTALNFPVSDDPSENYINSVLEKIFVDDVIREEEAY